MLNGATGFMKVNLDIEKDKRWNRQKIASAIAQGVLSGDSIPHIASRLRSVVNMDYNASIRNARTYMTAAENAGREDSYAQAQKIGIRIRRRWLATPDNRTRASHIVLDGEIRKVGEPFSNGLRYPGDPNGEGEEIYNCRCTLQPVIDGFEQDLSDRFMRLPEDMTYERWKEEGEKKYKEQQRKKAMKRNGK